MELAKSSSGSGGNGYDETDLARGAQAGAGNVFGAENVGKGLRKYAKK